MKTVSCALLAAALLSVIASAQNPAPSPTAPTDGAQRPRAMSFTPGTLIRAQLEKSIDSKKAQVGDQVLAKTLDDLQSVPPGLALKGCRIIGHIVEVSPHQGDTASALKIEFDKMVLKDGTDMPLQATIKAVGFADQFDPATNTDFSSQMAGGLAQNGNGQIGAAIGSGGGNPNMYGGQRMPTSGTSNPDAKLPLNAKGAIGMSGATLDDSGLTSKKHNVKLDGGMQMILKTK